MFKVIISGNLGQEPKEYSSQAGEKFWRSSLAVNTDKLTTKWVTLFFRGYQEKLIPHLTKGSKLLIIGKGSLDKDDKLTVSVNEIEFMGKKESHSSDEVPF